MLYPATEEVSVQERDTECCLAPVAEIETIVGEFDALLLSEREPGMVR
jgi:hypothetical protein